MGFLSLVECASTAVAWLPSARSYLSSGSGFCRLQSTTRASAAQRTDKIKMAVAAFFDRLWEVRDKRVDDWPLMASPWPTVTLCAAYVYCVTALGPTLMRDRQPFQLKNTILVYNLVQVLMSAYVVYEALAAGWATHYSWGESSQEYCSSCS